LKIVRFNIPGRCRYGVVEGDTIRGLRGIPYGRKRSLAEKPLFDGTSYCLKEMKLMAPAKPSKIVAVGLNYLSHARETKMETPPAPLIFLKPPSAVIGPEDNIVLPRGHGRVDYEGELAVVISRLAKDVPKEHAEDYILGYTCANDVSERHMQKADGQWTRAKGFDTFAPLGPWVETELDPAGLRLTTRLNGEVKQAASTSDMIFGVPSLLEFISGVMTLLPGDVIITGTPAGIGPMHDGDVVEITIEGIGTLKNQVKESA